MSILVLETQECCKRAFCSEKKNKAVGWDNAVCKKQFSLRGLALYMC